ncbi:MAG: putative phage tail protein [Candidatus Scalindua sp.]
MAYSALNYLRLLQSLIPLGKAWNRDEDSVLTEFLYAHADELSLIDGRSDDLITERDVRNTVELLLNHESELDMPGEYLDLPGTVAERKTDLLEKLTRLGQHDKTYLIAFAADLGYTITIIEYSPFWSGVGVSGDPCGDQQNIFHWTINTSIHGISLLDYLFQYIKPAHTVLDFNYEGSRGFSTGFSVGFASLNIGGFSLGFGKGFYRTHSNFLPGGFSRGFANTFNIFYGGGVNRGFSSGFNVYYGGEIGRD